MSLAAALRLGGRGLIEEDCFAGLSVFGMHEWDDGIISPHRPPDRITRCAQKADETKVK